MCLQVTNVDSCDEGSEKSSDQQYCSSQSSDFSPVSQMSNKAFSRNSLEVNSFCLSRGTSEKDVSTVGIKTKLSQKEDGNLMNFSSTFAAEKVISNETDVEIREHTAMSCFSASDGDHSNFEIASDSCVQNETAEENYEQAMNLCISDSHGSSRNVFCHNNDGLRKPRKATPVKHVDSSNGVSEFGQEKLTNECKISEHSDADPMSADITANSSLSGATGSMVIKVPVYKCSVPACSEKESSLPAYREMNNSTPLDLCVRGSSTVRKSELSAPEQSSVDDLSAQILLLSGKEYEIISLGGGRWISRNEYDLQKGLSPRKLVSKVPDNLQTNSRGFHPMDSQPRSVSNRQFDVVMNDHNAVQQNDFTIFMSSTSVAGESTKCKEQRSLCCQDSRKRLGLPDLVLPPEKCMKLD